MHFKIFCPYSRHWNMKYLHMNMGPTMHRFWYTECWRFADKLTFLEKQSRLWPRYITNVKCWEYWQFLCHTLLERSILCISKTDPYSCKLFPILKHPVYIFKNFAFVFEKKHIEDSFTNPETTGFSNIRYTAVSWVNRKILLISLIDYNALSLYTANVIWF